MATKCLHKYRLRNLARKKDTPDYWVYVCTKQDCSHHIRVEMVDGKLSECNRCGSPFIMKLSKLKHGNTIINRPHCEDCTKTPEKRKKASNAIDELVNSILPKGM